MLPFCASGPPDPSRPYFWLTEAPVTLPGGDTAAPALPIPSVARMTVGRGNRAASVWARGGSVAEDT